MAGHFDYKAFVQYFYKFLINANEKWENTLREKRLYFRINKKSLCSYVYSTVFKDISGSYNGIISIYIFIRSLYEYANAYPVGVSPIIRFRNSFLPLTLFLFFLYIRPFVTTT